MHRHRRLFAVAALGMLILGSPGDSTAQISPGKLSRAHESLEGVRNCTRCHGGGNRSADEKCLACHEAVAFLVGEGRGFHARLDGKACAECHPEHAGADFDLVAWDEGGPDAFEHSRSGWPLEGAHTRLKCNQCHQSGFQNRNVTLRMQSKHPESSWLGLDSTCASCHSDVHSGKLGADCTQCHRSENWHGVENFDHQKTGYALRGAHANVECVKCHQNGRFARSAREDAVWVLQGLPTSDCAKCHQDVHQGRFGLECANCHVVEGFKVVSASTFDHDRTRYPLRGAHRGVRCARCHDDSQGGWGSKPAFDRCGACHADAHAGTATLAGKRVDCDECHSVSSFRPSTFDVRRHANTDYALEGKHAQVECSKCHRPQPAGPELGSAKVQLRPRSKHCQDCHRDAHAGQLEGQASRCERCHAVSGFRPATYGLSEHRDSRFPLVGAHEKVECARCHASVRKDLGVLDRERLGSADFALRGVETECVQCHVDVHGGRYGPQAPRRLRIPCEECHTSERFRPSLVDVAIHQRFAFSLEGAHRATPCILCHQNLAAPALESSLVRGSGANVRRDFLGVPTACEACHTKGVPK